MLTKRLIFWREEKGNTERESMGWISPQIFFSWRQHVKLEEIWQLFKKTIKLNTNVGSHFDSSQSFIFLRPYVVSNLVGIRVINRVRVGVGVGIRVQVRVRNVQLVHFVGANIRPPCHWFFLKLWKLEFWFLFFFAVVDITPIAVAFWPGICCAR